MRSRRSSEQAAAARAWSDFVAANASRIRSAGLPPSATQSIDHWDDLVAHGYLAHHDDPARFSVAGLTAEQYATFADLVESYFVAGYEYFTPLALKSEDHQRLDSRFGS